MLRNTLGIKMKTLLLLAALSVSSVALANDLPKPTLQMDKTLGVHSELADKIAVMLEPTTELPEPNLILERGLLYTPSTRLRTRIVSGGNNGLGFRAVPESEYWKGN